MNYKKNIFGLVVLVLFLGILSFDDGTEKTKIEVNSNQYLEGDLKITSDKYILDKEKIKAVSIRTDKSTFLGSFHVENVTLELNCNNGTNYVGSGCALNMHNPSLKSASYDIVVSGDVTGDGNNTLTDIVKIFTHVEKKSGLSNESYVDAADIDQNGKVETGDTNALAYYTIRKLDVPASQSSQSPTKPSFEVLSKSIILSKGSTGKIETKIVKDNVTIIDWKSSNEGVAVVDSTGLVTGINGGSTTITATASNGDTATATVGVVVVVPSTGISMNTSGLTLIVGATQNLIASISPSDVTNKDINWKSSDSNIATVDANGTVRAVGAGTATITATTGDGLHSVTCTVTVQGVSLSISNTNIVLRDEESATLSATVANAGANTGVTWTSSDANIATVDANGVVVGKNVGSAVITATSVANPSVSASCTVSVREISVLMAGNSKTFRQDLPNEFKNIAASGGYSVNVKWFTDTGGENLSNVYVMHSADFSKAYDYVILQEKTDSYIQDPPDEFYAGATTIGQQVRAYNMNVQVYFRKTWVRNDSKQSTIDAGYANTDYVADVVRRNGCNVGIINDGPSMYDVLNNYKSISAFDDERHQSAAGAYLTSSCIYASLFKQDPTLIGYNSGLDATTAATLKAVAKTHCYG